MMARTAVSYRCAPAVAAEVQPLIAEGIDHREIELGIIGTEVVEQFEYLIDHPVRRAPHLSILLTTTIGRSRALKRLLW